MSCSYFHVQPLIFRASCPRGARGGIMNSPSQGRTALRNRAFLFSSGHIFFGGRARDFGRRSLANAHQLCGLFRQQRQTLRSEISSQTLLCGVCNMWSEMLCMNLLSYSNSYWFTESQSIQSQPLGIWRETGCWPGPILLFVPTFRGVDIVEHPCARGSLRTFSAHVPLAAAF